MIYTYYTSADICKAAKSFVQFTEVFEMLKIITLDSYEVLLKRPIANVYKNYLIVAKTL